MYSSLFGAYTYEVAFDPTIRNAIERFQLTQGGHIYDMFVWCARSTRNPTHLFFGIQSYVVQTAHSTANAGVVYFRIVESTTGYTITPCVGYFTSLGIDTRWKGPTAFSVCFERHWQSGVNRIAKVLKRLYHDSNPGPPTIFGFATASRQLHRESACINVSGPHYKPMSLWFPSVNHHLCKTQLSVMWWTTKRFILSHVILHLVNR